MKNIRVIVGILSVVLLSLTLTGCATTGRGEFPNLNVNSLSEKKLAILPTVGAVSNELQSSILYHLDRGGLRETFESVSFISPDRARDVLGPNFTIERLTRGDPTPLDELTDAGLVLAFQVNEFSVQEFTTTETRTLYRTNTSYKNTSVYSEESGNGNDRKKGPGDGPGRRVGPSDNNGSGKETENTFVTSTRTQTTSREIPVTRGNVRVVLSMSAVLYDQKQGEVIWQGQRIERAQDELADLSSIELKDIVVERIMYRINTRLIVN